MIDPTIAAELARLRRQIAVAEAACGDAVAALTRGPARRVEVASPFLTACAAELEALAGRCRLAADQGGLGAAAD